MPTPPTDIRLRRAATTTRAVVLSVLASWALVSCAPDAGEQPYRFTRFAMGTFVEYTILAPDQPAAVAAMLAAHAEVERVEALLGETAPGSQIRRFNEAADTVALNAEARGFLERAASYHHLTEGAFDASIKPVLDLYDFEAQDHAPPNRPDVTRRLRLVGMDRIARDGAGYRKPYPGIALTVGGVAKGYAVDRAVAVLRARGIRGAVVNAGGDVYCLGTNRGAPWVVGVRDPDRPDRMTAVLRVSDRAVATSGDYQRFFIHDGRRYHHLLDPATGRPARRVRSATVVAETAERADAMATALFVEGRRAGLARIERLPNLEGLVVTPDGALAATSGLPLVQEAEE